MENRRRLQHSVGPTAHISAREPHDDQTDFTSRLLLLLRIAVEHVPG
jgi:hypothetical protein